MQGILMKPDMIQTTVEGRKTQTRRVIKPQPPEGASVWRIENGNTGEGYFSVRRCSPWYTIKPRYHGGETVYIKEAHYRYGHWHRNGFTKTGRQKWDFKAETNTVRYLEHTPLKVQRGRKYAGWYKRPALFMPAWAARHFILIEAVRAERLQEITPEDCVAEGIIEEYGDGLALRDKYETLWDSINPQYPWESNAWVWAYQFRQEMPGLLTRE